MELNSVFLLVFGIVIGVGLCSMGFCRYLQNSHQEHKAAEE